MSLVSGTMYGGRRIASMSTVGHAALVHRVQQVAQMEHADDVLRRLAVDRVARVRRVEHRLQRTPRAAGRPRASTTSGRGRITSARLLVGEVEDLVEHLLLLLLELALDGRALEQHLQLGLRVDGALGARRLQPEQRAG